jgi:hypothetical protein
MISTTLVQLIESHWEDISARLIRAVRSHSDIQALAARPDGELREWCQNILENLGYLLSASKEDEFRSRFEGLGRMRFEENIPLHEAVLRLQMLKDKLNGFINEQGLSTSGVQLYAEGELRQRIDCFFDALIYHLVRGYESALRHDPHAA